MAATGRTMSMMTKTHELECCMCGDLGLSHLLFPCSLCLFRSQHSYCSNLYPKAESYKVCNWCLINKDNINVHQRNNLSISSLNNSNNKKLKQTNNHHNINGPGPKWLQPTSPIKQPAIRSPPDQSRSPSARKRITEAQAQAQAQAQEEGIIRSARSSVLLRRSMSTSSINNNVKMAKKINSRYNNNNSKRLLLENVSNNINKKSEIRRGQTSGGPSTNVLIKHVFRNNKVRRYKLLDEVSC